jgi:hypothetical protein
MFHRDERTHRARREDNARPDPHCLPIQCQSTRRSTYYTTTNLIYMISTRPKTNRTFGSVTFRMHKQYQ